MGQRTADTLSQPLCRLNLDLGYYMIRSDNFGKRVFCFIRFSENRGGQIRAYNLYLYILGLHNQVNCSSIIT